MATGFGFPTHQETFYTGTPSQSMSGSTSRSTSSGRSSGGSYYTPWQTQAMQSLYPQITSQLFGDPARYRVGMAGGPNVRLPGVSVGGIWSPQRIQEQVNLMRSIAEQQTEGQLQRQQQELLGRGYGSGSPILAALQQTGQQQKLAGQTSSENELRTRMDQMNRQHLLSTQQARAQIAAEQARLNQGSRNLDLQLYGQQLQSKAPMYGALGNFFNPLQKNQSRQQSMSTSKSTQMSRGGSSGGFQGY